VNDHEVEHPALDIIKELVVDLVRLVVGSAGDNLRILLDVFHTETF
jgi:hypothetical protein